MAHCSPILSNMKKSLGFHECGPKVLSNFGCLPWKCFPLNYYTVLSLTLINKSAFLQVTIQHINEEVRLATAPSTLYISEASKLSSNGLSSTQQRCVAQPRNWETIQQVVRAERPSHYCWEGNQVELHWLACYCRGWVGCATAHTAASVKTEKMRGRIGIFKYVETKNIC